MRGGVGWGFEVLGGSGFEGVFDNLDNIDDPWKMGLMGLGR